MKTAIAKLIVGCVLAFSAAGAQNPCGQGSGADIAVTNVAPGEWIGYPLLLVSGSLSPSAENVYLDLVPAAAPAPAADASGPHRAHAWPAAGGRFKALVELTPGPNRIALSAPGHRTRCLDVTYAPSESPSRIRMVYVLAADTPEGPDVFRTAPGDSAGLASARRRLAFGAALMETAMAELLHQAGYPRRTVSFRRDARGEVDVTVFHSRHPESGLRGLPVDTLYEVLRKELDSTLQDGNTKFMSMLGRFASLAMGGNNQAMSGTTTLYSWALGPDDLVARFSDNRKPGDFQLEDESAFRNTFWSNYSTGIGAALHELGHALGLPNLDEEDEVMQRGFDRFNRIFMVREDGKAIQDQAVHYGAASADRLLRSRWVQGPASVGLRPGAETAGPRLEWRGNRICLSLPAAGAVTVDLYSPAGTRIARLAAGPLPAGDNALALPALRPGLYFCAARRAGSAKAVRLPILIP